MPDVVEGALGHRATVHETFAEVVQVLEPLLRIARLLVQIYVPLHYAGCFGS